MLVSEPLLLYKQVEHLLILAYQNTLPLQEEVTNLRGWMRRSN